MENITIYNNVRFANRIDKQSKWIAAGPVLAPGEIAFVRSNSGDDYYMVVGREGETTGMDVIVDNPRAHASHIFYPASSSSGGGGTIPIASDENVGGVKVSGWRTSGLMLDTENGNLKNGLLHDDRSYYSHEKECFVIHKLHVDNLSFGKQTEHVSASGNYITVRAGATGPLDEEYAGILVHNINGNDAEGFLGINQSNQIVLKDLGTFFAGAIVSVNKEEEKAGYIVTRPGSSAATVEAFKPLTFKENEEIIDKYTYTPDKSGISIDLTPPVIKVNGQLITCDLDKREYDIALEGGLTEENARKLEQFGNYTDVIEKLNKEQINVAEGDKHISVGIKENESGEGQTITVTHNEIDLTTDPYEGKYFVYTDGHKDAKDMLVVMDIDVDKEGHVTKVVKGKVTFVLK